jgi:hypothetical protein
LHWRLRRLLRNAEESGNAKKTTTVVMTAGQVASDRPTALVIVGWHDLCEAAGSAGLHLFQELSTLGQQLAHALLPGQGLGRIKPMFPPRTPRPGQRFRAFAKKRWRFCWL